MKQIKAQPLTKEKFSEYGDFYNLMEPEGHNLGTFFHDHVLYPVSGNAPVGFSALLAPKCDMVVTKAEYHNTTPEILLPLDGDVVIHVAPPSTAPEPELTEAFYVPKGTIIRMNTGVWHMAPFPVKEELVHLMVALPERIYFNDCYVVEYEPDQYVEINL